MQQNPLPNTASVSDGTPGTWAPMLQQSPLQIQDHQLPMPQHNLNEAPDASSFNSANPANCTLIDMAPPISHTYINPGYSAPSSSTMQSSDPAQSTEKGHSPGLDTNQVLASVPQWYAEHLATTIQLKWPPWYTCTEDFPTVNPMPQDQATQPLSNQRPHQTYASQLPQCTTIAGQISEPFKSINLWKHGMAADYTPADYVPEVGAIYPTVDTQQPGRQLEKSSRAPVNDVGLVSSQAYCFSNEHHPAICAPISNHPVQDSFAHISYV